MVLQNCKKIVFKWVLETGLMENHFVNIDDKSIDDFLLNLFYQLQSYGHLPKLSLLRDSNLVEALRVFRNKSQIEKSTINGVHVLSQNDYSFLYFLFLHFAYVKYNEEFCRKLCKKISMASLRDYAKFMKQLYFCPNVNTHLIRNTIMAIIYSPPYAFDLSDNGQMNLQRECVRYFGLPVQMFKPTSNHVKCKMFNLQASKRLFGDIFQKKGETFFENSDTNRLLNEEKNLLHDKLPNGDNQVVVCMSHLRDLNDRLTEVRRELKQKDAAIQYLLDKKDKLEQILTKILSFSENSSEEKTMFSQYLEVSNSEYRVFQLTKELQTIRLENLNFAKKMQYLTEEYTQEMTTSKDNIGLKPYKLDDEYYQGQLAESFDRFTNCIDCLKNLYKKEKIKSEQLVQQISVMDVQNKTLCSRMADFEKELGKISAYTEKMEEIEQLNRKNLLEMANCKSFIKTLVEKNKAISAKLQCVEKEYEESKLNADVTEQNCVSIIGSLQTSLEEFQHLNSHLMNEKQELQGQISTLTEQLNLDENEAKIKDLSKQINDAEKTIAFLQCSNKQLNDKTQELQHASDKLNDELRLKATEYRINVETFFKRLSDQSFEIENYVMLNRSVREQYEKLLIQHESLKREISKREKQMEAMRTDLTAKSTESDELRIKTAALRSSIHRLSEKQKHDKKTSDLTIKRKEKLIKDLEKEKEQFENLLQMVRTEHEYIQKEMRKLIKQNKDFYKGIEGIWHMLKQEDEEFSELIYQETQNDPAYNMENKCVLYNYLVGIQLRLKLLIDFKRSSVEKIKDLEMKQNQRTEESKAFVEKLHLVRHEREEIIKNYENIVLECKKEINCAALKLQELKPQEMVLDKKMFLEVIENQLHGEIVDTLTGLVDYKFQLKKYEKKVQQILQENTHLGEDFDKLRISQSELSSQLYKHISNQREVEEKLKNSESRCRELEQINKERESSVERIRILEEREVERKQQIQKLNSELETNALQRESELKATTVQLDQIKEENAVLVKSLADTAEKLKLSIEHADALEKLCIELRGKLSEATASLELIQADSATKFMDLKTKYEDLVSARLEMQDEINAFKYAVAEKTELLETNNTEVITITDTLETNLADISTMDEVGKIEDIFDINENEELSIFKNLKLVLNKMMNIIMKLKENNNESQEAHDYAMVLEQCNAELEKKLTENEAKTYVLQETIAFETCTSLKKRNLEKMLKNLAAENTTLKCKLTAYEREILNLKTESRILTESQKHHLKAEHLNLRIVKDLRLKDRKLKEKLKVKKSICNELQRICSLQEKDISEKSSIIQNFQKNLSESNEQNSKLRSQMKKLQLEISFNDNNIKVLNEKCRSILESNTCPTENDLSIQSGESVGLQAKIVQLACIRNNLTKCIFVYKKYLKNASKRK